MSRPVLYLMLGYPGAGKTTLSKILSELTGAEHLWADHERRSMFKEPVHSKAESDLLYAHLNNKATELLAAGKSVIYDTNFNYYRDRQHLRLIADRCGARTVLIWLTTAQDLAMHRAVHDSHGQENRVWGNMTNQDFQRLAGHLESPHGDENAFTLDGQAIDEPTVRSLLDRIVASEPNSS